MSNDIAIRVENLSKRYRIGLKDELHDTFGGALVSWLKSPLDNFRRLRSLSHFDDAARDEGGNLKPEGKSRESGAEDSSSPPTSAFSSHPSSLKETPQPSDDIIWALRDVSFDVKRGEVLGIIGRNGAGKSTLLKILSRITEPTSGRVEINGRVASLLEVGTGFHPELTGRENTYLNGTILGMSKKEVEARFDEIVEFSGVEKFIDTPVKRYSSGMRVRLAFAVAAHLDPEILLIDEVLAVGDFEFQRKCLGKMGEVARSGRTILFVSHNMAAIRKLCGEALWLHPGRIVLRGEANTITEAYLQQDPVAEKQSDVPRIIHSLPSDPAFRFDDITLRQQGEDTVHTVVNGKPLEIIIDYRVQKPSLGLRVYFDLCDENDDILVRSYHDGDAPSQVELCSGRYRSAVTIPADLLAPRRYRLVLRATLHNVRSCSGDGIAIALNVMQTGRLNRNYVDEPCVAKLAPLLSWSTQRLDVACVKAERVETVNRR